MRISDWSSDVCSSDLFEIIGGKWKALILWELHDTPVRFGALKRRIAGISEKMLIQQLREMEADGLVHREMFHQVPPSVDYSVTTLAIGRASRREKGGKYVEIRAVAVTLKKQKK